MTPHPISSPTHPRRSVAMRQGSPLLGLCLAAIMGTAQAGPGTSTCPGSTLFGQPQASLQAIPPLPPGTTNLTSGTNLVNTPGLQGPVILSQSTPVKFSSPQCADIRASLEHWVVGANNGSKDCYWCLRVKRICANVKVNGLRVTNFRHPKSKLLAGDYRNDLVPGGLPSTQVTRSAGAGRTITFGYAPGIGFAETTHPVFVDTSIANVDLVGEVQLLTSDGGSSPKFATWAPIP